MVEVTFNAQRSTFKCEPPVVLALAPPPERFGAQEAGRCGSARLQSTRCSCRGERLQRRRSARVWKHLLNQCSASDYLAYARSFLSHHRCGDYFLPAVRASALRSETDSRPFRLAPDLDLRG